MYLAFVNEIGMRTGTSLLCSDEWHLFAYCLNVFRCTEDVGNYMGQVMAFDMYYLYPEV
jgi:hypothetical protein